MSWRRRTWRATSPPWPFTSFLRDREALERLSQKVAADKPDFAEINAKELKLYQYQDADYSTEKLKTKIAKAESLVNRLGTGDKGPAYAVRSNAWWI